ncbi:hypothetical protein BDU57DRAFT_511049 [Ampelomyces quisqualis]|uniref:Uncharacterized protein n=1 Tax=Ampelomyces quisqualis TaxID=50730 RepID=A0A6A5R445_AMPQU|nr:hypothetical protein BDU57DRAFT_511049 [Ampelomyces quisqualis]
MVISIFLICLSLGLYNTVNTIHLSTFRYASKRIPIGLRVTWLRRIRLNRAYVRSIGVGKRLSISSLHKQLITTSEARILVTEPVKLPCVVSLPTLHSPSSLRRGLDCSTLHSASRLPPVSDVA